MDIPLGSHIVREVGEVVLDPRPMRDFREEGVMVPQRPAKALKLLNPFRGERPAPPQPKTSFSSPMKADLSLGRTFRVSSLWRCTVQS